MILKGYILVSRENRDLVKHILREESLDFVEFGDVLYLQEQEKDPKVYSKDMILKLLDDLRSVGVKEYEIEGYCKVQLFYFESKRD